MRDFDITTKVVREYFTALDCSKSLAAWLLFSNNEHQQLLDLDFCPTDYNDLVGARDSLSAVSFLSKANFLNLSFDRREMALEKFRKCEMDCSETNDRITLGKSHETRMFLATRKIASILGKFEPEEFIDSCSWGPGATLNIRADRATAATKFDSEVEVTPACYQFVRSWFHLAYPRWYSSFRWKFSRMNKLVTVPKNSKIDRVIAIEPSLNLWFQKGVGAMIRRRLSRIGIDLNDQRHNQRLSRLASKFNQLATIDFSSASDTISSNLVLQLIPSDWLEVLCALRSPSGSIDGASVEYEKFSSMGNGFTFELESLLFYALAEACVLEEDSGACSIYGDDLIIPSKYYELCENFFSFCGFTINAKKSYHQTYYRESCGKHWWNGVDITPLYLKETVSNEQTAYKIHNAVRRYAHNFYGYGCDPRFLHLCNFIVKSVKARFKRILRIPEGLGDGGIISNFDEATPSRLRHGHEGYVIKLFIERPFDHWTDSPGLLLSRLWCTIGSDRSHGNVEMYPRRTRAKIVKSTCTGWYDLGPWL
ncbi:RNA-directed RNA polymerase [ssRNA phage Zoerhiza.1_16]|uniref:RNA-directed RNA polymerase n=2 Tax=Fiersviridae TaxID=2842319 RepID=A0A8S5L1Y9_9VIRU|nr:RNA-directed RNA polymerase [ssRNA phage Zoerhiza.1_16]QDH91340.1 MAG: RNA-dependent RNA polymerase [Leviviridae sp.]DAD51381.1 TPA_asm: RNA-directed RNA polymerase [ssRNA phage Zoerhiza.1_16]